MMEVCRGVFCQEVVVERKCSQAIERKCLLVVEYHCVVTLVLLRGDPELLEREER